jgi:hypothetical protein
VPPSSWSASRTKLPNELHGHRGNELQPLIGGVSTVRTIKSWRIVRAWLSWHGGNVYERLVDPLPKSGIDLVFNADEAPGAVGAQIIPHARLRRKLNKSIVSVAMEASALQGCSDTTRVAVRSYQQMENNGQHLDVRSNTAQAMSDHLSCSLCRLRARPESPAI